MPTATPYSAVNNRFLGNEKDVGAVLFAYPVTVALVNPNHKDKQPVSPRHEILYTSTTPYYIQQYIKGGCRDIKSPTWTFRLRYLLMI